MPTYQEYDESVQDSAPIEAYKFVGTFKTYRYTSTDRIISIAGQDYSPIAVTRSNIKAGTQEDDNTSLDITMPYDTEVVMDCAYGQTPPELFLTVYRLEGDDPDGDAWITYWQGIVRGFSVDDRGAKVQVPSIFSDALSGDAPDVYYQVPCNHVLYDNHCQVSRLLNTFSEDVQSYIGGTVVTLQGIPTTNGDLAAGEMINTRNGERRLILGNVGATIDIGYPFVDLLPGDTVEMSRGCNHLGRDGDCLIKFGNYDNYGGHEDIPPDNPFQGEIG
jgi:hypothetical protein